MGDLVRGIANAVRRGIARLGRAIGGGMEFSGQSARRQDPDLIDPEGLHVYDSKAPDPDEPDERLT